jgi:hypothetical protein
MGVGGSSTGGQPETGSPTPAMPAHAEPHQRPGERATVLDSGRGRHVTAPRLKDTRRLIPPQRVRRGVLLGEQAISRPQQPVPPSVSLVLRVLRLVGVFPVDHE